MSAYLLSVNTVLGSEPTGAGFPRPPLAPGWLLVPFAQILGADIGYKVWSALASLAPVAPVYLLARRLNGPSWVPLFAVGFLLLDPLHAEMIVTGALPLIGFALLGMVWWGMCSLAERPSWRVGLVTVACLALIPYVNHTTAGLAIVTVPVLLMALLWFRGCECAPGFRLVEVVGILLRIMPALLLGGLIALGALPWYMEVLPGAGLLDYPGPVVYFTHAFDTAWWQFGLAWLLGVWMIRKAETPWLRSLGVLVCLLGTLLVFRSYDETVMNVFYRSIYLLALPFYVGITWAVFVKWLPCLHWRPWLVAVAVGLTGLVMVYGYIWQFQRQQVYSEMVSVETVEALAYIRGHGQESAVINNSFTLGLWIAALNRVAAPNTWNAEPPPAYTRSDGDVRCLLGWVSGCQVAEAQARLEAGWVLIDTRFPYYNKRAPGVYGALDVAEPWSGLPGLPWLESAYSGGTVRLWRIVV